MRSLSEILEALSIVQSVSNEERNKAGLPRLGKGYFTAYRLNPYNPLSYVLVVAAIPVILVLYGVVGLFEKIYNPFQWD